MAAARRPAIPRNAGPTAAAVLPARAPLGTWRIGHRFDTIIPHPVVSPFKHVAVQVKQAADSRAQGARRMNMLAAVFREPAKSPQQAHLASETIRRPSSRASGHFPLRLRRQPKTPTSELERPGARSPVRLGIRFSWILLFVQ